VRRAGYPGQGPAAGLSTVLSAALAAALCAGALAPTSGCTSTPAAGARVAPPAAGARSSDASPDAGPDARTAASPDASPEATVTPTPTAPLASARPSAAHPPAAGPPARPGTTPLPGSALAARPGGPPPTAAGVRAAVAAALADPELAGRLGVAVVDPRTGRLVYGSGQDHPFVPASTQKLFTAVAAIDTLGAERRLATRVVRSGAASPAAAASPGAPVSLVLVGGGDVSLARTAAVAGQPPVTGATAGAADVATLAARTAAALPGVRQVRLSVDTSLFTGPAGNPHWAPYYLVGGQVSPVSALSVDAGRVGPGRRVRSADPGLAGAQQLASDLRSRGLTVTLAGAPVRAAATAPTVAAVQSPTVAALVAHMLTTSDNDYAEALFRLVAVASGQRADFRGGAGAVLADLRRRGVDVRPLRLYDGSGLSRLDRATPTALAAALSAAVREPALRPVADGLGVAGVSGTVATGFTGPAAAGRLRVRAKTGTLSAVSALAGTVSTAGSGELVFAFLSDTLHTTYPNGPRRALELAAARLAECGCHVPGPAGPLR